VSCYYLAKASFVDSQNLETADQIAEDNRSVHRNAREGHSRFVTFTWYFPSESDRQQFISEVEEIPELPHFELLSKTETALPQRASREGDSHA